MKQDAIAVISHTNNIRERIGQYQSDNDPGLRLKKAAKNIDKILDEDLPYLASLDNFKTLTINEFDNGLLMCESLPDQYRTFAIEMMRQLQQEYNCQTTSEKATCELVVMAFIRIFEYQQLMFESEKYQANLAASHTCGNNNIFYSDINRHKSYFGCSGCNRGKLEQQHYQTLGKELDRANRTYLSAIQTLRMMKQAPMQITVKAQTAVIGQNQQIQNNHINHNV